MEIQTAQPTQSDGVPRKGRVIARFGIVAAAGFQPLPDMLLFHQQALGLRSEDLIVLLNLMAHWYWPERAPFPTAKRIALRMGVSERTVERSLSRLRKDGLIERVRAESKYRRKAYDVRPLVERLKPFAESAMAARELERTLLESRR